ncbi:MAG: metallophosphoesterase [Massiliimalia sp.]
MSLYTLGDLHLSLGTDKPMDIFRGWDNYVTLIEKTWNHLVAPEDTVVVPGDISWAMKLDEIQQDFAFIHRLNGRKILLKGNHDLWFSTKSKVENYIAQHGFDSIHILFNNSYEYEDYVLCGTRGWINEPGEAADKKILNREAGRLRMSLEDGKKTGKEPIVFLHYPPIYGSNECYEILDVMHEYGVKKCYYGHIHGNSCQWAINGERGGIEFRLVSCDFVQFTPVKVL